MAKEKPTDPAKAAHKAEKKAKKEKRSETDGVHKSSKKDKKAKDKAIDADKENTETTTKLLNTLETEKPGTVIVKEDDGDIEIKVKAKPLLGALVPFAHPMADEKVGKKVLKSVKKGEIFSPSCSRSLWQKAILAGSLLCLIVGIYIYIYPSIFKILEKKD